MKLKHYLFIWGMVLSMHCFSQNKIVLSGRVSYGSKPTLMLNSFTVIVNDTLNKVYKESQKRFQDAVKIGKKDTTKLKSAFLQLDEGKKAQDKITTDSNLYFHTKVNGLFKIEVDMGDSLFFQSPSCLAQKFAVSDLVKMDSIAIKLIPEKCIPFDQIDDKNPKRYVIIAEKVELKSVSSLYCNHIYSMDSRYEAKYKIVKNVYGNLNTDTVRFTVFDHYGIPAFSEYKYVLLFLSEYNGKIYHEKYQYFDVYPTKNGKWARPGNPYALDEHIENKTVKSINIRFKDSVVFERSDYYPFEIKKKFNEPYFKFVGDKIYPVAGVYIEDLLEIKRQGVLKERGFILD